MLWDEKFAAYGEPITHDFKRDVALWERMREEWIAENTRLANGAKIVELSNLDGSRRLYVHQTANSGPNKWQVSEIIDGKPWGHEIYPSFQRAIDEVSGGEMGSPGVYKVVTTR